MHFFKILEKNATAAALPWTSLVNNAQFFKDTEIVTLLFLIPGNEIGSLEQVRRGDGKTLIAGI